VFANPRQPTATAGAPRVIKRLTGHRCLRRTAPTCWFGHHPTSLLEGAVYSLPDPDHPGASRGRWPLPRLITPTTQGDAHQKSRRGSGTCGPNAKACSTGPFVEFLRAQAQGSAAHRARCTLRLERQQGCRRHARTKQLALVILTAAVGRANSGQAELRSGGCLSRDA